MHGYTCSNTDSCQINGRWLGIEVLIDSYSRTIVIDLVTYELHLIRIGIQVLIDSYSETIE